MGFFDRLKKGLGKTSDRISTAVGDVFKSGTRMDAAALETLEDVLIQADMGVETAIDITEKLGRERFEEPSPEAARERLAQIIGEKLAPYARPLEATATHKPAVMLFVGVNGSGKTTTIGKLAAREKAAGKSVMVVAGDTFRAGAIDQLKTWGARAGVPVIAPEKEGADAAGLVFGAHEQAEAAGTDVLMIDTAGRLQNRADLMDELAKIVRILKRRDATAPQACVLVLDATVGQNAFSQVEVFKQMVGVTGLVVTKLDGSAKGGVVVGLADKFKLPVHYVGVGETLDDLQPFDAEAFARALIGLDTK